MLLQLIFPIRLSDTFYGQQKCILPEMDIIINGPDPCAGYLVSVRSQFGRYNMKLYAHRYFISSYALIYLTLISAKTPKNYNYLKRK